MRVHKFIGYAAFAAALGIGGAAQAGPSAGTNLTVSGSVPQVCSVGTLATSYSLGNIADENARVITTHPEIPVGTVGCNFAAYIKVGTTKGSLKSGDSDCDFTSAYHTCVQYDATLSWNGDSSTVEARGDESKNKMSEAKQVVAAGSGELILALTLLDWETPILAGEAYSDTLVLYFGANL